MTLVVLGSGLSMSVRWVSGTSEVSRGFTEKLVPPFSTVPFSPEVAWKCQKSVLSMHHISKPGYLVKSKRSCCIDIKYLTTYLNKNLLPEMFWSCLVWKMEQGSLVRCSSMVQWYTSTGLNKKYIKIVFEVNSFYLSFIKYTKRTTKLDLN